MTKTREKLLKEYLNKFREASDKLRIIYEKMLSEAVKRELGKRKMLVKKSKVLYN